MATDRETTKPPPDTSPRQDHSQDRSTSQDGLKPSGDSPKPHGDKLADVLKRKTS